MPPPETRFVRTPAGDIGYQIIGEGPLDLICVSGFATHLDLLWDYSPIERFFGRLASFCRVILFDQRGTGVSGRLPFDALPSWEEWTDDMRVILDAVGSKQAAILAEREAGAIGTLFAAMYPERISALILANTSARFLWSEDYPYGETPETWDAFVQVFREHWGTELFAALAMPSQATNKVFREWSAKTQRSVVSRQFAAAYISHMVTIDTRHVLPIIRVPTLILHQTNCGWAKIEHGRYLADHISGAKFIELPGCDGYFYHEGADEVPDHIQEFLTGVRGVADSNRILATVLFTDIVGSTERTAQLGDQRWHDLLDRYYAMVRRELSRFRGREVDTAGDGFFAAFDGPARAIRCAVSVRDAIRALDIDIRVGLHAGECEVIADKIGGIAVHTAARVMANARPGEILASSTVKDLVAGSAFRFRDLGVQTLKGIPGEWHLFAVE